jgi:ABC-type nitrate/sulfonate/bicarbonate transport system permease component
MSMQANNERLATRMAYQVFGFLLLLLVWQIVGKAGWFGKTLPAVTEVLHVFTISWRRALLLRAATASLASAGLGLAAGTVLGLVIAIVAHLFRELEPGLDRLAVVANAMPAIALGPVLIITAGREATPALLATIPVFFLIYVAASAGLRNTDPQSRRYFMATGANRWRRLLLLDATSAIPSLLSGLKIAVTTAMIGTIVGEWFGAPAGLGIVLLNTMQNFQVPLMWATVMVVAGLSLTAYGFVSLLEMFASRRFA